MSRVLLAFVLVAVLSADALADNCGRSQLRFRGRGRQQVVFNDHGRARFNGYGSQAIVVQNRSIVGDVLDSVFGRQRVIFLD